MGCDDGMNTTNTDVGNAQDQTMQPVERIKLTTCVKWFRPFLIDLVDVLNKDNN
jgi:hypothetical protein